MSSHLALQYALWADEVVKDVFGHVGIHGGQRVVQQVDVSVAVQGSGQAHPLSLATGEVDALKIYECNQISKNLRLDPTS